MSSLHTLRCYFLLSLGGVQEHEVEAHVSYWFTKAWPEGHDDPGSDALVEIDNVQLRNGDEFHRLPSWLVDAFRNDDELIAECLADRVEDAAAAADYAAEARSEDAMLAKARGDA